MATKSTKQLARELGLLRKRKVCRTPSKGKKSKIEQVFSYLIVLDFESTCWDNDRTVPQEIIEFPAVLLNCSSGQIESTFQHYVLPSERPRLSQFCQKLTGISQDQVDNGIPLSFCLRKFYYWLKKIQTEKGVVCVSDKLSTSDEDRTIVKSKLAAFVTWSDWDLGVCLLNEAKRKQIMKPSVLDRWIDLRATYRTFYGRRPDGLNGAMKDLGLQFDGREHSGIDDAKNTAQLANRMMRDGCVFQITKTLKMNFTVPKEKSMNTSSNQCHQVTNQKPDKGTSMSNRSSPSASHTRANALSFVVKEDKQIVSDSKVGCQPTAGKGLSLRCTNIISSPQKIVNKMKEHLGSTSPPSVKCAENSKTMINISNFSHNTVRQCISSPVLKIKTTSSSSAKTSSVFNSVPKRSLFIVKTAPSNNLSSSSSTRYIPISITSKSIPLNHQKSVFTRTPNRSLSASDTTTHSSWSTSLRKTTVPHSKLYTINSNNNTKTPKTSTSLSSTSSSTTFKTPLIPPHLPSKKAANVIGKSPTPVLSAPFKSPVTSHSYSSTKTNCAVSTSSSFRTPTTAKPSVMRVTPPLCSCGRRSRRRLVQNPGPNEGRWFFSCTIGSRSFGDNCHSGCGFFQWDGS